MHDDCCTYLTEYSFTRGENARKSPCDKGEPGVWSLSHIGTNARTAYVLWWLDCVLGVFDGGRGYVYVCMGIKIRRFSNP